MVAVAGSIAGVLAISDPLKPEARGVVAALHLMGLTCHLVTGDNWRTARAVAEQLAIPNVCAECLPGAKSEKIKVVSQCSLMYSRQSRYSLESAEHTSAVWNSGFLDFEPPGLKDLAVFHHCPN